MSNTFQTYIAGGSLPPITAAACSAWAGANETDAVVLGPTPSATGVAAILDAIHSLETAVVALQGS
jgi:hypothetical protein